MGRASANLKIVEGNSSPSRDRSQRKNAAHESGAVVPWKEMERRVAERIAAKANRRGPIEPPPWKTASSSQSIERAPDSGVRTSEPKIGVARELSFTVYSVEDLDARQRTSAPPPSIPPPPPSRWPDVWRSTKVLMSAWCAWRKTPKPRSRLADVCGVPFATLRVDLFAALRQLPWKTIAIRSAIGFGSFFFLLFIVLTAAELTDDLKPRSADSSTRSASVAPTSVTTVTAEKIEAPKPVEAAPAAQPEAPAIEIDDAPVAAVAKKPAPAPKKKPTGKKKKDLFNP